jgi:hypothetical protein
MTARSVAHQAIQQSQKNINEGYKRIVEIDLIPKAFGTMKLTMPFYFNLSTEK